MNRTVIEIVVSLLVAAVFAILFQEARTYSAQSRMMPMAVTGLAVVLSLVWTAQTGLALARGAATDEAAGRQHLGRLAAIMAAVVIYILAMQYLGFFSATILMIPLLSGMLGYSHWRISVLVTLCFAVVLYAVFRLLLSIPLPPETLLEMVIG